MLDIKTSRQTSLFNSLRQVPIFSKLPEERVHWLIEQGEEVWREAGEIHRHQGEPAEHVFVLLEGEIRITQKMGDREVRLATYKPKTLYGELPVLLGHTHFWAAGRAAVRSHLFELPNAAFWELLSSCTCVMTSILRTMAERLEAVQSLSQHREKLVSLGTLAAGLAHELNNPASAARRAAGQLRETVQVLQPLTLKLSCAQTEFLVELQQQAISRAKTAVKLDPLTQSDREDEITDWLEAHDIDNCWKLAPTFVTAGIDIDWLENVKQNIGESLLSDVLAWIEVTLQEMGLLDDIEHSTTRISTLVEAVKDYSYMDRAPIQEIDIHEGLDSTLTILSHKIKQSNVAIKREYGCDLPRLSAYGSELNQVWTNLIDNAIDALENANRPLVRSNGEDNSNYQLPTIWIRTNCDRDYLLVEIADNGPGIPPDIQSNIFEPFFTTKGVGKGTGLGLHIAYQIVGQHQGDIRLVSQPGNTTFQIHLPLRLS